MNFCLDYCNSLLLRAPASPLPSYNLFYTAPREVFSKPATSQLKSFECRPLSWSQSPNPDSGFRGPMFRPAMTTCSPCFSNTGLCRSGTRMATPQALRTSLESSPPPLPHLLLRNYLCSSVTFPATPSLTARYKMATIPIQHPCSPFLSLACSTGLLPYNKLNSLLIYLLIFSPNQNRNPMNKAGTIFFSLLYYQHLD